MCLALHLLLLSSCVASGESFSSPCFICLRVLHLGLGADRDSRATAPIFNILAILRASLRFFLPFLSFLHMAPEILRTMFSRLIFRIFLFFFSSPQVKASMQSQHNLYFTSLSLSHVRVTCMQWSSKNTSLFCSTFYGQDSAQFILRL